MISHLSPVMSFTMVASSSCSLPCSFFIALRTWGMSWLACPKTVSLNWIVFSWRRVGGLMMYGFGGGIFLAISFPTIPFLGLKNVS